MARKGGFRLPTLAAPQPPAMLGSMTVRALVVIALVVSLTACGTSSVSIDPTGVDGLVVPTPSPDPDDFVEDVDNRWLPLPAGRTWAYEVTDLEGAHRLSVKAADGPEIAGVATTARISTEPAGTSTDYYAQDTAGNVWWFGREGVWRAGEDGAEAGLAMPAGPRVGDGYRTAYLPGVVEDVASVLALTGSATVPAGSYDDLLVTRETTKLAPGRSLERSWAQGVGLVEEERAGRVVRLSEDPG
jgi:hypothetical protein